MIRKRIITISRLTLVEVMVAVSVSSIAMTMILTVVLNLYSVFRDGTVDYKMVEGSYLLRQKVLRNYGLRQAFWDEMTTSEGELDCFVISSQGEWPTLEVIDKKTRLSFNSANKSLSVVSDLNSDSELALMGIKVRDVEIRKVTTDLEVDKVVIDVLFEKVENGKVYVREETINIPSLF